LLFAAVPHDPKEAEHLKSLGNAFMQKKEYEAAAQSYTQALKLSPSGPNSHVHFSNWAAALLSMRKLHDAILDLEHSLKLKPNYGKAHARLGLVNVLYYPTYSSIFLMMSQSNQSSSAWHP
jgi:tetratricopeptide (TPR) repeat protein